MFTHLHAHSYYSFQRGTIAADRLPVLAMAAGMKSVALTDTNNVSGVIPFYNACLAHGIKPIIGTELRTPDESVVLLAKNADGYRTICETITSVLAAIPQVKPKLTIEDALKDTPPETNADAPPLHSLLDDLGENVIILSSTPKVLNALADRYKGNIYIELAPSERHHWKVLREIYKCHALPVVATNNVHFETRNDHKLHRLLRAIGTNTTIGTLPKHETASEGQYFANENELRALLKGVSEIAFESVDKIVGECNVEFDFSEWKFAEYSTGDNFQLLKSLATEGFRTLYSRPAKTHFERFEYELEIIAKMNATSYYLATYDMIQYAKRKGYPYLGRGSGANSLIAYCLGLANVDPVEHNLRFERFLNPERKSFPDFDMDFSWKDRYNVINYMIDKYGRERCAMLCTIQSYRDRGTVREVGKAFGYPDTEINELASGLRADYYMETARGKNYPEHVKNWITAAGRLQGFPRHLSVHAGGLLIADKPITHYTAVQQAPIGVPITQQDMFSAEDWKLVKLDILATRGLGTFWDTLKLVEQREGKRPQVETDPTIAFNDERTKEIVRTGKSRGCFYIESPAMIGLLRKLRCDTFEMLTAASSVIRPGVAQSGMMQEFIKRHHDPAVRQHMHPLLGELMRDTYGIMVYQEDVLIVVHEFAGLSYGEADIFRRSMSGKNRSHERMSSMKGRFIDGCVSKGHNESVSEEMWRQVSSFAGYSFCKAHSASYAILSFQEAWLKVHYPAEFMCSVLNNQGGFYNHQEYINEAKMLGIKVLLPDVNRSEYEYTVDDTGAIRVGWLAVKSLSQSSIESLIANRPYSSVEDLALRSGLKIEEGRSLIAVGACDCFDLSRPDMMTRYTALLTGGKKRTRQETLDFDKRLVFDTSIFGEYDSFFRFHKEREILGLSVTDFPAHFLKEHMRDCVSSVDLHKHVGKTIKFAGHIVAQKGVTTRRQESMLMLNMGDEHGVVDIVVWPRVLKEYYLTINRPALKLTGKVTESFGVPTIEVVSFEAIDFRSEN